MKRGLLFLIIFLLSITAVSAVQVTYDLVQDEALPGGEVSYLIHINNNEGSTLIVNFAAADLNWLLSYGDSQITVPAGETKDQTVKFVPLSEDRISPGNYGIRFLVSTQLTTLEKLLPAKVLAYNKVLDANFDSQPIVDPRRNAILRLNVTNKNKVNLDSLNLEFTSPHFQFTRSLSLGRKESVIIEFPIRINSDTLRGNYTAKVHAIFNNHEMLNKELVYTIDEYEALKELTLPQAGFLIGGETITETNDGNTPVSQTIRRSFGWFSYKFASFETEPTRIVNADEGTVAEWDVNLNPGETIEISYSVNYRLPIIILILIVAALAAWYVVRQRNAVVIVKRVFAMHTETGSVKVMKVLLNLRNRGSISVHNVRVVDKVPNIIKAPTQHGNAKPSHVKSSPEGTVMVWDITNLRPGEERVISYRIEGKIQVLGKLSLPPASAKYVLFGRGVAARSSRVSLHEKK